MDDNQPKKLSYYMMNKNKKCFKKRRIVSIPVFEKFINRRKIELNQNEKILISFE
tara:strand:+ start:1032 stop:1196 length:165 start_codon:yes stop_codon:yes gene_type:complete